MGFIDRIVREKTGELELKQSRKPLESLAVTGSPPRDFRAALAGGGRIVAELKAKTPTVESFTHSSALEKLAHTYEQNGAAAISIVTDEKNFGTSLADVTSVRGIVGLPVLVKDFIVDPYQIVEARNAGADAVLLIVRILDWDRLVSLLELAHALGMSALVECHDENDVRTALKARSPIVGINNRDLDTLRVDLETTERLSRLIPAGVVLVAESGIHTRRDIERLSAAGAGAFLVGGALLDAPDAGAKLRELRGVALIPEGKGS